MQKVVMVGRDKALSEAFDVLKPRLEGAGVVAYLGHGDPIKASTEEIEASVRSADVLLCGMSSSSTLVKDELAAIVAASAAGVPVVLYADQHGRVKSEWFVSVRNLVNAVLVVGRKEVTDARDVFPNAEVVLSGNPSVEESHFPKTTKEWARERLGVYGDEKVILIPGYKFPAVSMPTVFATLDALNIIRRRSSQKFFLVVSLHPGDDAFKTNPDAYAMLISYFFNREVTDLADTLRVRVTCSKAPNEENRIATSDILPGADIMVVTLSTEEEKAACQRIPCVHYLTATDLDRMEKNFGSRTWTRANLGISWEVFANHAELAEAIEELLDPDSMEIYDMRQAQETHYPRPTERGATLRIMTETVLKYASK